KSWNTGQRGKGVAIIYKGLAAKEQFKTGKGVVCSLEGLYKRVGSSNTECISRCRKLCHDLGAAALSEFCQDLIDLGLHCIKAIRCHPATCPMDTASCRHLVIDFTGLDPADEYGVMACIW